MNRDLEHIAIAAARECVRQGVDEHALINLLRAHEHAYRLRRFAPTVESILTLAALVEPEVNRDGYRRTAVTFANGPAALAWAEIPDAVDRLVHLGQPGDVDDFVHHLLDIHPFRDGNGRVAWVLWNWLAGRLADPADLWNTRGLSRMATTETTDVVTDDDTATEIVPAGRAHHARAARVDAGVERLAYTVQEACAALTITRPTLYKLIADGRLRTVTVGTRRLIPATELTRLLAGS